MLGWGRTIGLVVALLAALPTTAGAQYYTKHFDPANPDAFDREQAKVTAGGAAAAVGGGALLSLVPPDLFLRHRRSVAAKGPRVAIGPASSPPAPPERIDLLRHDTR